MNSNPNINPYSKDPSGKLSREWIDAHRNETVDDLVFNDNFEKDAYEGWQKSSDGTKMMKKLDQKFLRGNYNWIWISSAVVITASIVFFSTYYQKHSPQAAKVQTATTLDKSDVILSEEIKAFKELPSNLQILPAKVSADFKTQIKQNKSVDQDLIQEENIVAIPLKSKQTIDVKPIVASIKKSAKEIYLADFKLIDYRAYRSKPEIYSQQILLSGTPANQEQLEYTDNDPAWTDVNIPYHDYIQKTILQFKNENYRATLNRTQYILKFYPDDLNALFYGGLCYYNLREFDLAIDAFEKVNNHPFVNFDEEASWYLANAYYLKNDKQKAKELFISIIAKNKFYKVQAEKFLEKNFK